MITLETDLPRKPVRLCINSPFPSRSDSNSHSVPSARPTKQKNHSLTHPTHLKPLSLVFTHHHGHEARDPITPLGPYSPHDGLLSARFDSQSRGRPGACASVADTALHSFSQGARTHRMVWRGNRMLSRMFAAHWQGPRRRLRHGRAVGGPRLERTTRDRESAGAMVIWARASLGGRCGVHIKWGSCCWRCG